jgi:antitoxin component of MazEF toxin-antitoxin module
MPHKTYRKLKLQPEYRAISNSNTPKKVPSLKLCGAWMEKLGFKPGDRVNVITREKLLIIEPLQEQKSETNEEAFKEQVNKLQQEIKK